MSQSMMYLWARDADLEDPFAVQPILYQVTEVRPNWASDAPAQFSVYRHYKGGQYVVLGFVARREDDWMPKVAYASISEGCIWVRKISEWLGDVRLSDGKTVSRFEQVWEK